MIVVLFIIVCDHITKFISMLRDFFSSQVTFYINDKVILIRIPFLLPIFSVLFPYAERTRAFFQTTFTSHIAPCLDRRLSIFARGVAMAIRVLPTRSVPSMPPSPTAQCTGGSGGRESRARCLGFIARELKCCSITDFTWTCVEPF